MMDNDKNLEELLKQVSGGKLLEDPSGRINHIIKLAKKANMTKDEFIKDLPKTLINFRLSDGNNLDNDVKKVAEYVEWRWDYI